MFDFIKAKEEDPNKIYSIIQKIHSNNNKYELYKVKHRKTGDIYAAKIIKDYTNNHLEKLKLLKKFESPYIVQFYQTYIFNNSIWIITEFCDCGSLLDIMKITNKCYKEIEIASILIMVLKGLQFLHLQKKYHGGIKPSNILINNEGVAKLSDFNISSQLFHNNYNNNVFTTPPELLKNNNYNIKCDIWYLGLTCIELAEGALAANNNKKEKNNKNNIKNNNLWSLDFIDFIQKCLNENPVNRPSAAILINHPFIINNNKGKIIIKKKINNIKSLIDIYREKIDEQEEKNNINDNKDIAKDSLEMTSFNDNLSLSQSDEIINNNNSNSKNISNKKNNISLNINPNRNKSSILNNNKDIKEKINKKNKIKKIKISIKNRQIHSNNINKPNGLLKINKEKTSSKKRSQNKTVSLKKPKISSFEIYDKIKHNHINGNIPNEIILSKDNDNNKNKKKRHSMINKYFKNNNYINPLKNNIYINTKLNNTQENMNQKNNLKLLNNEKIHQNKNTNKSQRINRLQNVFVLAETTNNKKIKHKYNYSLKVTNNKNKIKDKKIKDNKSLSSIDSLKNSKNYKNFDKKVKSKTRNKKSNGGNQNLSEIIDLNKYGKKSSQKKNILLRNLILNNSNKNIITEVNIKMKNIDDSKISSNENNINNNNIHKLNRSMNINNYKNIKKKIGYESKLPDINNNNLNKNSKTPIIYYFKSGEIKRLKRPPLSHSLKKNNFTKKIKQIKKNNYKINTSNINYTNKSIKDNDKSDYIDNINNTNYTYINNSKSNNQSYSYNRNDKNSLTEEELKLLCLNNKVNDRGLPELITELAGLENKMNQEIQKIKDHYEPIIKQHKEGIKFLKQNPFLKNIKEYKNFENFKKKMKLTSIDDLESRSISSSVHNLNKIKISFYKSNDIEELNILANKYILDNTGNDHHGLIKI